MTALLRSLGHGLFPLGAALALAGCVSFGEDPPETLLNLTSSARAPAEQDQRGSLAEAIAVLDPDAPRSLDVLRVPVQVDETRIAYLKDAVWVEKPARLFGRLLAENLRAGGKRFVVEGADLRHGATTQLGGQLLDLGYDARRSAAMVRFDAVLRAPDGSLRTRRFEAEVSGVAPDARSVGPALNQAANDVAAQVAAWVD